MAEEAELDVKNTGTTDVEDVDTKTEPSTAETNTDGIFAISGDEEEPNAEGESEQKSEDDAVNEANSSEPSHKNAETRKQQLNNEIRDRVAERNALRREIAELNRQKYQLKSIDDIPTVEALMEQQNPETGDYYTRTEAKLARIEAERELDLAKRQLDEYTENIVDNRLRLKDEATKALRDFPMFDEESDSYNKDLAEQANRIADSLIIKDKNTGEIIGSHGSIYDVYALVASAAKSAETTGKIAGRKAAVDMMNSADVVGGSVASSSDDEDDPFLKGFDKSVY